MYYIKTVCLFKLLHFILTFHLKQSYFLAIPFPLLLLQRPTASQIPLVGFFLLLERQKRVLRVVNGKKRKPAIVISAANQKQVVTSSEFNLSSFGGPYPISLHVSGRSYCKTRKSQSISQSAGWKATLYFERVETEFNKANRMKDIQIKSLTIISHLSKVLKYHIKENCGIPICMNISKAERKLCREHDKSMKANSVLAGLIWKAPNHHSISKKLDYKTLPFVCLSQQKEAGQESERDGIQNNHFLETRVKKCSRRCAKFKWQQEANHLFNMQKHDKVIAKENHCSNLIYWLKATFMTST